MYNDDEESDKKRIEIPRAQTHAMCHVNYHVLMTLTDNGQHINCSCSIEPGSSQGVTKVDDRKFQKRQNHGRSIQYSLPGRNRGGTRERIRYRLLQHEVMQPGTSHNVQVSGT